MDDSVEVLKSWFSVFYQFDGLIIVLKAFFDETGGDETKDLTAVAGFVYDEAGLTEFTEAWAPHITGLSKPYRTSTCNAGYDPFNQPDWPHDRRQFLMDKLATLSVDHSLAGFVTATTKRDYEEACENGPGIGGFIDSPYTLCLMGVLSRVSEWVSETEQGMKVHCWCEAGGFHEREAHDLLCRLRSNTQTAADFMNIEGYSWTGKNTYPQYCSADLLAWEWQRNVLRSPDKWTPRMEYMIKRMRRQSKNIGAHHITGTGATVWAVQKIFPGLQLG